MAGSPRALVPPTSKRPRHYLQCLPEPRQITVPSSTESLVQECVVRGFGGCAASHVEGTGPAHALRAILVGNPWVVVTVPALVPRARLLGWSRESATTSLVTGLVLIPFGRLHVFPSLPPPRLSCVCSLLLEAAMTPHKDYCLDPPPPVPTPMLPESSVLSDAL